MSRRIAVSQHAWGIRPLTSLSFKTAVPLALGGAPVVGDPCEGFPPAGRIIVRRPRQTPLWNLPGAGVPVGAVRRFVRTGEP